MFTVYDEYELLELFESEPIVIGEPDAGMNIYIVEDKYGFKLTVSISIYEQECLVALSHRDYLNPIFDICLTDVTKIFAKDDTLYFEFGEKVAAINLKPNFSLSNIKL